MSTRGNEPQVTYHADSRDLIDWRQKDSPLKPVIVPDPRWYVAHDAAVTRIHTTSAAGGIRFCSMTWFKRGRYVMTVTARRNEGTVAGARVALPGVVSRDLVDWEVQPPLYAPSLGMNLEVTELFAMDGRYFLIFCHGETNTTRYRVADRPEGPYRCPVDDVLLPTYMYAPRTIERQGKRYLIPWVADRSTQRDNRAESRRRSDLGRGAGTPQEMRCLSRMEDLPVLPADRGRTVRDADARCGQPRPPAAERSAMEGRERRMASSDQGNGARLVACATGLLLSCGIRIRRGAAGVDPAGRRRGRGRHYLRLEPALKSVSLWSIRGLVLFPALALPVVPDLITGKR